MNAPAPQSRPYLTTMLAALTILGAMPYVVNTASAVDDADHVLTVDRTTPYFGFDDPVGIRVIDPIRKSTNNVLTITVSATAGTTTVPITLREVSDLNGGEAVGVYVGTLSFATSGSGNGVFTVPQGTDALAVTLVHDPGAVGGGDATAPVVANWRRTFDATLEIGKGGLFHRFVGKVATVQVNVTDLDHKGVAGGIVHAAIQSDTEKAPTLLPLKEEMGGPANNVPTGRFFGNFTFRESTDPAIGPGAPLDLVDQVLGTGNNVRATFSTRNPVDTGSFELRARTNHFAPHLGSTQTLLAKDTVVDAACDGHYQISEHGQVTLCAAGVTALGTRSLVASYDLPAAVKRVPVLLVDPNFGPDLVDRAHRERFTVYYHDTYDADGRAVLRGSAQGEWLETQMATFEMLDDDLVTPLAVAALANPNPPPATVNVAQLFGLQSKLGLRVVDEDANVNKGAVDTVDVRVESHSTNSPAAEGASLEEETIPLTETGPNTGEFVGKVGFETTRITNNDLLQITTATSQVTYFEASYADTRDDDGLGRGRAAVAGAPGGLQATRVSLASTGTGALQLVRVATGATSGDFFGLGLGLGPANQGIGRIRITDSDISDCTQLASRVRLRSADETETIPWIAGDRVGTSCEKIFGFEPPAGPVPAACAGGVVCLKVSGASTFTLEYTDPTNAAGLGDVLISTTAVWRQAYDASVTFGFRYGQTFVDLPIVVQDPDETANQVFVRVTSTQDPGGVNYALNKVAGSPVPGTYSGVAKFETLSGASSTDPEVAVANAGVAVATYVDPRRSDGTIDGIAQDAATIMYDRSGAAELRAENLYAGVPVGFRLRDTNAKSGIVPVFEANVTTPTDPVGETVRMRATGIDQVETMLGFEGGLLVDSFVGTGSGNPPQSFNLAKFPLKPDAFPGVCLQPQAGVTSKACHVRVFVDGLAWNEIREEFGGNPTQAPTGGFDCASPRRCVATSNYTVDRLRGIVSFGQADDSGSIPQAGANIVVLSESFEYFNETLVAARTPTGSGNGLRLQNAISASLLGASPTEFGQPAGALLVNCGMGRSDEQSACNSGDRQVLRGDEIMTVTVDGARFTWCPSADCATLTSPSSKRWTFDAANGIIYAGSPAQAGSVITVAYRGYDRAAGTDGVVTTVIGIAPRPQGGVCQLHEVDGAGAETLIFRSATPYTENDQDGVVEFAAAGGAIQIQDNVRIYRRAASVAFGGDGTHTMPDGSGFYNDTDHQLGAPHGVGSEIVFNLVRGRVCNRDVAAPSTGDLITIREVRVNPLTQETIVVRTVPTACYSTALTELYTEGRVVINPNAGGGQCAFDADSRFQVTYNAPTLDIDLIVNAPVTRGFAERIGRTFTVAHPLAAGFDVRYCPTGVLTSCNPPVAGDVVVNPRTGAITLTGAVDDPASGNFIRIGSKFKLTGQVIANWNREVGFAPGQTATVTYFDPANNVNQAVQVGYTLGAGAVQNPAKGTLMFLAPDGTANDDYFGLQDVTNISVMDVDKNRDPNAIDTFTITIQAFGITQQGQRGTADVTKSVTLFETGVNSGEFRATVKFGAMPVGAAAPSGVTVLGLTIANQVNQFAIVASYDDVEQPAVAAYQKKVSHAASYRPATRGQLTLEPALQVGTGTPLVVRVADADRNGRILQERVAKGTGLAFQSYTIIHKPILPESQTVYVENTPGERDFEAWAEVDSFSNKGPTKVYTFNDVTGEIGFGDCQLSASGNGCTAGSNGVRPKFTAGVGGAEIRIDYFQRAAQLNDAFVRLETYVLTPGVPFDASRDARPDAVACALPCFDRLDLRLNELATQAGVFQSGVPFAAPNAAADSTNALLEVPNPSQGVDQAVIVATYFDYSYVERFRPRSSFPTPAAGSCPNDAAAPRADAAPNTPASGTSNNPFHPWVGPFQQGMPGQSTFPGILAGRAADFDCQTPLTSVRDRVLAVTSFTEAGTGVLSVNSRNQLLPDGTVSTDAQKLVYGPGKLEIRVADPDLNGDRTVSDTAKVVVDTDSSASGAEFTLREADADSAVFVGKTSLGPGGLVPASPRDKYTVSYSDARNENGVESQSLIPPQIQDATQFRWHAAATGSLSMPRSVYIDASGQLGNPIVRVADAERNQNPNARDSVVVRLSAVSLADVDVDDAEAVAALLYRPGDCSVAGVQRTLEETDLSTGVFQDDVSLTSPTPLAIADGQTLRVTYCDPHDAQGREGPLSASVSGARIGKAVDSKARWFERSHGQVFFDKARYVDRGEELELTVIDNTGSFDAGVRDQVAVVVSGGAVSRRILLNETGFNTGEFQGEVGLEQTNTDATPDLAVPDNVQLRAVYVDKTVGDASARPGVSIAEAVFARDTLPPTTLHAIASELPPVTFGGQTWYKSPPSITLTATDALSEVARTEFRWGATGSFTLYTTPFSPPGEGRLSLQFRSVDAVGNAEALQNVSVNWDQTAPTAAVTTLNATQAPGGIRLSFQSPVDVNNPLEFGQFLVYRDSTTTSVATSLNTTTVVTAPDEAEHTYYVRVSDAAGNEGPLSAGVTAIADITPPTLSEATILPRTTFAVGEVAKVDFSVKVLPTPDDVVASVEVAVAVPGSGTDTVVMADPDGDNVYTGAYANFTVTGLYDVTFRALDAIGNAATAGFVINVTGRDTTPPTITPLAENTVVPQGEALRVRVRDNIGVTRVTYRLDGGSDRQAAYAAGNETALIPTESLALGPHTMVLRAFDAAGNSATAQMAFVVIPPLPPGVPPPPLDVRLVTQASGDVVLRWILVPSANLDHFEIWRSASPAKLVGTVDPDEDCNAQGECSFTDRTAKSGTTYTYCILAVNATDEPSSAEDYPSRSCSTVKTAGALASPGGTFLEKFWWVFLIAAAIVVGVAVFLVQREERAKKSRSRQRLEAVPTGPGERHHIKCPACNTRFTVTGTKPIVTNCPHCGKKGILR